MAPPVPYSPIPYSPSDEQIVFRRVCRIANDNRMNIVRLPESAGEPTIILLRSDDMSNGTELAAGRRLAKHVRRARISSAAFVVLLVILSFSDASRNIAALLGALAAATFTFALHAWTQTYNDVLLEEHSVTWTAIRAPATTADLPQLLYPYLQAGWETVNQREYEETPQIIGWTPANPTEALFAALREPPNAHSNTYTYVRDPASTPDDD